MNTELSRTLEKLKKFIRAEYLERAIRGGQFFAIQSSGPFPFLCDTGIHIPLSFYRKNRFIFYMGRGFVSLGRCTMSYFQ